MAVRIEDAGFEIRDMIAWLYGSGFPKSHNGPWGGTALKPALEPITVARKPLDGTVAENVLAWGTGGLNVDWCRVGRDAVDVSGWSKTGSKASENRAMSGGNYARSAKPDATGRWPANLIHDGSDEVVALFLDGAKPKNARVGKRGGSSWHGKDSLGSPDKDGAWPADAGGSAARFFYCAKASKADRDEGCEGFEARKAGALNMRTDSHSERNGMTTQPHTNHHPTVKPTALMRYLCRLVTPPGGTVLDPFCGSGSTGKGAVLEGFNFIGIEREEEYMQIAEARIAATQPPLFAHAGGAL